MILQLTSNYINNADITNTCYCWPSSWMKPTSKFFMQPTFMNTQGNLSIVNHFGLRYATCRFMHNKFGEKKNSSFVIFYNFRLIYFLFCFQPNNIKANFFFFFCRNRFSPVRFIIPSRIIPVHREKKTHITNAWGHRSNDTSHQEREKIIKLLRIRRPGEEQGKTLFPRKNFRCGTKRYGCEYATEPSPVGTNREVFRFLAGT